MTGNSHHICMGFLQVAGPVFYDAKTTYYYGHYSYCDWFVLAMVCKNTFWAVARRYYYKQGKF